jgi:hypothetical protein
MDYLDCIDKGLFSENEEFLESGEAVAPIHNDRKLPEEVTRPQPQAVSLDL